LDGNNILDGGDGDDVLIGSGTLNGGNGDDYFNGNGLLAYLNGGAGNDYFEAMPNSIINGGSGNDIFSFGNELDPTVDAAVIEDFVSGSDTILLNSSVFLSLFEDLDLSDNFTIGSYAENPDHYLIFNPENYHLYYDFDGIGESEQIHFATLTNSSITYTDIEMTV
jgi:Ca2+-binding RTX toxin-like protein